MDRSGRITQREYYSFEALLSGVRHGDRKISVPDNEERASQATAVKERITTIRNLLEPFKIDKREPVCAELNEEKFAPRQARFVRFTIEQTNDDGQPILDELEVFAAGQPENIALAGAGAKVVTSAGDYTDNPLRHKPEYLNDGKYGDLKAWISKDKGKGWLQIELAQLAMIDRVVWSRDLEKLFSRNLPTHYHIEVAEQPGQWTVVSRSDDRLPFEATANERLRYSFQNSSSVETDRFENLVVELRELIDRHAALTASRDSVYVGTFKQPPATHRRAAHGGSDPDRAFRKYVRDGLHVAEDPYKRELRSSVFGSEDFLRTMVALAEGSDRDRHQSTSRRLKAVSVSAILQAVASQYHVAPEDYARFRSQEPGRDMAAWLCRKWTGATLNGERCIR